VEDAGGPGIEDCSGWRTPKFGASRVGGGAATGHGGMPVATRPQVVATCGTGRENLTQSLKLFFGIPNDIYYFYLTNDICQKHASTNNSWLMYIHPLYI
jgi:hypothetical protein